MTSGLITHVQRFSLHDGPGIRTTIFLKGCQMRCPWCHNPETLRPGPEIQVFPQRCIGCRQCVAACPAGAHEFADDRHAFHRHRCTGCGACAETCYAKALVRVGEQRTAESLAAEAKADAPFYRPSGGVTLSGGEPLAQPPFSAEILRLCRAEGIHTAVETNLAWPWEVVARLVPLVDLFLIDVKMIDDAKHRAWTGLSNGPTLDNIRRLDAMGRAMVIRTPVIVGVNDRPEAIAAAAEFLAPLRHVEQYDLLPYHPLGGGKREALGLAEPAARFQTPGAEQLAALAASAARGSFRVTIAGQDASKQLLSH